MAIYEGKCKKPTQIMCKACHKLWCSKCNKKWDYQHPESCKGTDIDNEVLAGSKRHHTRCPSCNAVIFRISGCNHMNCSNCGEKFNFKKIKIKKRGRGCIIS